MKKLMKTQSIIICWLLVVICLETNSAFAQGNLTPPGPPAPIMKSLDQIQPRTPISSASFFISQPGSYYLTTNLVGSFGIGILVGDVTLDLNGFTITSTNSSDGILVYNNIRNLCIRNGSVSQCGSDGINAYTAQNSQFEHLQLDGNAVRGLICGDNCVVTSCNAISNAAALSFNGAIIVGNNCVVKDCVVQNNRGVGIFGGGSGDVITGCSASGNLGSGISTLVGAIVRDCTAVDNTGQGITVGDSSVLSFCLAQTNSSDGFVAGIGCTINACSSVANIGNGFKLGSESTVTGCTASQNNGDGIQVLYSCLVQGNTCGSNSRFVTTGGAGVHAVYSGNRIEGNTLNSNQYGIRADGNENIIVRNTVRGSGSFNFYIAADNMVGIITNAIGTSSLISGNTGGSGLGSTDPWANFSY
jgi:parallel beta-helix repeat protein